MKTEPTIRGPANPPLSSSDLLAAIQVLTKAIECYRKRIDQEVSIHWGNGVILRVNGIMIAGGMPNVSKVIAKIQFAALTGSATSWTMEWREHGRWIKSCTTFRSEQAAIEHAQMIGATKWRVLHRVGAGG